MNLSNQEKEVLLALRTESQQTSKELVNNTKLVEAAVNKSISWLKEKELINVVDSVSESYELDEEGLKYLNNGFPERIILEEIKENKKTIKELVEKYNSETIKIANIWLRRLNTAMIINGEIQITPDGKKYLKEKFPLEITLEQIETGETANKELIEQLKKRGKILKVIESKTTTVELTTKGSQVSSSELKITDEISILTPKIIKTREWQKKKMRKYNVESPVPIINPGKKQMYYDYLDEVREKMIAMGFKEMKGNVVQTEFWNFDALFQPQGHPTRGLKDTYYLKSPKQGELLEKETVKNVKQAHEKGTEESIGRGYEWEETKAKNLILRSHTTCLSAQNLLKDKNYPLRYFSIGRTFRRDVIDASHLPEFNQLEGIVADESLTLRDLLGMLESFAIEIAGIKNPKDIKFKCGYFPYTEPSVEMFAKHPYLGWTELGGSGMFRPEMLEPLGVKIPVAAWGLGVDRLAMFALGIKHIKDLFSQDLKFLQSKNYVREL